jgi:hypothetical protein
LLSWLLQCGSVFWWRGQYPQAYELASEALATIDGPETWLHMVDVAVSAIETVADAVDAGLHEPHWIERAAEWHARFDEYSGTSQRYVRLRASATADLARAQGNNDPDLWRTTIETWADAPYWHAKCQWRLANSLAAHDRDDPEVSSLLADAENVAAALGAMPLLDAVRATRKATAP